MWNEVWFVAFTDEGQLGYSRPFTVDGFRHCFAFSQGLGGVMIHNFDGYRSIVSELEGMTGDEVAVQLVEEGKRVLKVIHYPEKRPVFRGFTYCVSIVKSLLGVSGCYAFTPYGLYKWLKKSEGHTSWDVIDMNEIVERAKWQAEEVQADQVQNSKPWRGSS